MMQFPPPVHADGNAIKPIAAPEMSRICIGHLWPMRHKAEVRVCIRRHVGCIRQWQWIESNKAA